MKLRQITELDKRNTATSENLDGDVLSANLMSLSLFIIYGQFAAFRKLDSGGIVYKTFIFINSNLLFYKK